MSESDACSVLGIQPGANGDISEEELKAAYRRWVLRCTALYCSFAVLPCRWGGISQEEKKAVQ